jgi:alkylation response protein AidB-like acyl-CoA dehydrogenase
VQRTIFDQEHDLFRASVRSFVEREIAPFHGEWIEAGIVPRDAWRKAGAQGFLCLSAPEEYGGAGIDDFRFPVILAEELIRRNCTGPGFGVHGTVIAPYILRFGTEQQKQAWVPGMVAGDLILAVAMTEPSAGSDLASLSSTAVDKGDHYLVNGRKAFVTNGVNADLILASCITDPALGQWGVSLLAIESDRDGVSRSGPLSKIGWRAQDTAEVFFDDVRVPKENLIGKPGQGFHLMSRELDRERLYIAASALAASRTALDATISYCKEREAFGKPIGTFQHSRFTLAEMETEVTIGQEFIDRCIMDWNAGVLSTADVAKAKWWATDLQQRTIDRCLQLHGGYGYMTESPIAQAWVDMRWTPIGGGTNEIMKELIGRTMGF